MKKSLILAMFIGGCTAQAPAVANVSEMFWFPDDAGGFAEFTDEEGYTYMSAKSEECLKDFDQDRPDPCLGIVSMDNVYMIDAARDDNNILTSTEYTLMLDGVAVYPKNHRIGSAIVIEGHFKVNGKKLTVTTPKGTAHFNM